MKGVVTSNIFMFPYFFLISISLVTDPVLEIEAEVRGDAKSKATFQGQRGSSGNSPSLVDPGWAPCQESTPSSSGWQLSVNRMLRAF